MKTVRCSWLCSSLRFWCAHLWVESGSKSITAIILEYLIKSGQELEVRNWKNIEINIWIHRYPDHGITEVGKYLSDHQLCSPLHLVPKCHIHRVFEHFQGWWFQNGTGGSKFHFNHFILRRWNESVNSTFFNHTEIIINAFVNGLKSCR